MIVRNYTPFRTLLFDARDVAGREFGVFVMRGTFDLVPGAALRPSPEQRALVEVDVWHGAPNESSVYVESDLAPFKPRADILVNAVAHAPEGRPLPEWAVRVQVGMLSKALRVTGPRHWTREGDGWTLSEPEPVAEVPLRYEHAFGGTWKTNWGGASLCKENPVGVGHVGDELPQGDAPIPAPQIDSPEQPVTEVGKAYAPEGLGPIARSWQPRLARAGTFDEPWQRSRWPELPEDFEFTFHNAAHPDLIYPDFLNGDEEVTLEGMTPEGALRCYLPGYKLGLLLRHMDGSLAIAPVFLDTLFLDVPAGQAHLTWRAPVVKTKPIRVLEARMAHPTGRSHG
ncbi:DUF2169 family type VI secretion system accessory protein [Chondromyces apiculatus]|uniref:DUF2169 domain-containing protein n=1 Tax=Chondromyces apiculatus DSM 436 TaxID=1192034 RepID=A0A017SZV9_9BACT|nr:DUF2169 domain-containing protein [Chondromyces apiculatus]EYF02509.1 Hypothetical protein CAP_6716 [Chondromyces apiculatus DSM 436]